MITRRGCHATTSHGQRGTAIGPHEDRRAVFDRGDVRIESCDGAVIDSRRNARTAFAGLGALRRSHRWDALDATYFAGYALWNYLSTPLLLTRDELTIAEGHPSREAGELRRRLDVTFPAEIHTHSPRQTFYVDTDGLVRRHVDVAQPVGRWAYAAHYCHDHRSFAGLLLSTRRRVRPRVPGGQSLPGPLLVALDIDHIDVQTI